MNFFKQAEDFAASANTNNPDGDNTTAAPTGDGSGAPPAGQGTLPGGRTPPTDQELLQSGRTLFDAAQGQNVDQSQLAGAAGDLLGGLAAHGNLDQGTYGTYINQAESYLDKYGGQGQSQGQSAAGAGAGAGAPSKLDSQADSQSDPSGTTDQSDGSFQSPSDGSADPDSTPVNAGSTDDYQQQGGDSTDNSQY